jgi:hypothetical protein
MGEAQGGRIALQVAQTGKHIRCGGTSEEDGQEIVFVGPETIDVIDLVQRFGWSFAHGVKIRTEGRPRACEILDGKVTFSNECL